MAASRRPRDAPSFVLRFRLLISAFIPMMMIVAVRVAEAHRILALLILLASTLAFFSLLLLLAARDMTSGQPFKITYLRDESGQVPAYLLTYVFPFIFVDPGSTYDLAAYAAFILLLVVMLLRTDLILVNPVLLAFGYHLFHIQAASGFDGLMLARDRPKVGETIEAVHWAAGALKLMKIRE